LYNRQIKVFREDKLLELFELKADIREGKGKNAARELRRSGKVPAVLYGPEIENENISVVLRDVELAFRQSDTKQVLVNLTYEKDGQTIVKPTLIKDVQVEPSKRFIKHLDFLEIDPTKKINVMVPVEPVGKSVGVENEGGILQVIRRELEIYCMPNKMPETIKVDVTALGIGDSIHVEEIVVDDMEIPHEVNFTVITVVAPTVEASEGDEDEDEEGTVASSAASAE
jgi:large subunit ribosomal protein L25